MCVLHGVSRVWLRQSWQITGFTTDSWMCAQAVTHAASASSEPWLQKHWEMKHFFTSGFGDINKLDFKNCSNKSYCFKKASMAWDDEEILLKIDRFHERSSLGVPRWVVDTWQPQHQTWRWWKQTGPSWTGMIPRQLLWWQFRMTRNRIRTNWT